MHLYTLKEYQAPANRFEISPAGGRSGHWTVPPPQILFFPSCTFFSFFPFSSSTGTAPRKLLQNKGGCLTPVPRKKTWACWIMDGTCHFHSKTGLPPPLRNPPHRQKKTQTSNTDISFIFFHHSSLFRTLQEAWKKKIIAFLKLCPKYSVWNHAIISQETKALKINLVLKFKIQTNLKVWHVQCLSARSIFIPIILQRCWSDVCNLEYSNPLRFPN